MLTYDFIFDQTEGGSRLKMLTILDEYTRECLNIDVERKTTSIDVISTLEELFSKRGVPSYIRSDNGPEFIATAVRKWLKEAKVIVEQWRLEYNNKRPHKLIGGVIDAITICGKLCSCGIGYASTSGAQLINERQLLSYKWYKKRGHSIP